MEDPNLIIATPPKKKDGNWWLAQFISYLLHPLLLPTWAFGLVVLVGNTARLLPIEREQYLHFMAGIVSATLIIPLCLILILYNLRLFKSLHMQDREDRLIPFMMLSVFYAIITYLLSISAVPRSFPLLFVVTGGMAISIILVTLITYFWKISAHSTGMSGVIGVLVLLYYKFTLTVFFIPILLSVVLLGALMSARLYLGEHSPAQVWLGALLGFLVNLGVGLLFF